MRRTRTSVERRFRERLPCPFHDAAHSFRLGTRESKDPANHPRRHGMKRHTFTASLALVVLAILALTCPAAAGEQVPFHGSLAGVFTISGFPIATVSANLTGNATHLGRFTLALPHHVDLSATPPSAVGTFVFIAANGDTVFG